MITKPASASGCADSKTTSPLRGADPRGSNRSTRRSRSSASSACIFSSIVVPGTSSTPPTTIRLGSPSAWASTHWMTLAIRIRATLPTMLVVVTGAGSGIGRAAMHRFAQTGAHVLAADLDFQKAHETCAGLPHATPHKADVTKREDIEKLLASRDRVDVYFNNAGVPETVKPLAENSREEWDTVLDVNLTSLFIAAQVAAPKLKGGVLIQTGSIIANRPRAGLAAYVA